MQSLVHQSRGALGAILDALPAHIALIDRDGVILAVNAAWRRFAASNGMLDASFGLGQNYLEVCK